MVIVRIAPAPVVEFARRAGEIARTGECDSASGREGL
jgi:hypothetical protein